MTAIVMFRCVVMLAFARAHAASTGLASTRVGSAARAAVSTTRMSLLGDRKRHFLHVDDLTPLELDHLMTLAAEIKAHLKTGATSYRPFNGKTMSMIFAKPSTRTRVSFETGLALLGGHALCLGEEVGLGTREAVKDVSRVLASMNDMIMARLFSHADLIELAKYSKARRRRAPPPRAPACPRARGAPALALSSGAAPLPSPGSAFCRCR